MKIFGGIIIAFGVVWLLSGAAHIALIFLEGDLSHIYGAAINFGVSFLAIWLGLKLYRRGKRRQVTSTDESDVLSGQKDLIFNKEASGIISEENAKQSAFNAAKNSFMEMKTIVEPYDLGGMCHFLMLTSQDLVSTFGHEMSHEDSWFLVKAAAVDSGKYTESQIVESVMHFDKVESDKK